MHNTPTPRSIHRQLHTTDRWAFSKCFFVYFVNEEYLLMWFSQVTLLKLPQPFATEYEDKIPKARKRGKTWSKTWLYNYFLLRLPALQLGGLSSFWKDRRDQVRIAGGRPIKLRERWSFLSSQAWQCQSPSSSSALEQWPCGPRNEQNHVMESNVILRERLLKSIS